MTQYVYRIMTKHRGKEYFFDTHWEFTTDEENSELYLSEKACEKKRKKILKWIRGSKDLIDPEIQKKRPDILKEYDQYIKNWENAVFQKYELVRQ